MPQLLFLHGALYTSREFSPLVDALSAAGDVAFDILRYDFPGHGQEAIPDEPFSIDLFARSVLAYLDQKKIERVDIFGYSMGGYVALYLARHYPERVGRIFTLATKLRWNSESSSREAAMLDAEKITAKVPQFGATLAERHGEDRWREVLAKTAEMMINLGEKNELPLEEFASITHRVRLGVGDRDAMVSIDETAEAFRALPDGELLVLPRTPHPLEKGPVRYIAQEILGFFN